MKTLILLVLLAAPMLLAYQTPETDGFVEEAADLDDRFYSPLYQVPSNPDEYYYYDEELEYSPAEYYDVPEEYSYYEDEYAPEEYYSDEEYYSAPEEYYYDMEEEVNPAKDIGSRGGGSSHSFHSSPSIHHSSPSIHHSSPSIHHSSPTIHHSSPVVHTPVFRGHQSTSHHHTSTRQIPGSVQRLSPVFTASHSHPLPQRHSASMINLKMIPGISSSMSGHRLTRPPPPPRYNTPISRPSIRAHQQIPGSTPILPSNRFGKPVTNPHRHWPAAPQLRNHINNNNRQPPSWPVHWTKPTTTPRLPPGYTQPPRWPPVNPNKPPPSTKPTTTPPVTTPNRPPPVIPRPTTTPGVPVNKGQAIAQAALAMIDKYPYSWGGGSIKGATTGIVHRDKKGHVLHDDRGVVGFDCQGLAKYSVFQGSGVDIGGHAASQYKNPAGTKIPIDQAKAGDLVFFKNKGGIHHVGIIVDPATHMMVEAPSHNPDGTGKLVRLHSYDRRDLMDNAVRFWD